MPFWNCYYHFIWATKNRKPIISPLFEKVIFEAIQVKSKEMRCTVLAINGIADHLHVAVCIQPGISVARWVGKSKALRLIH
jgi:putative transposase